MTEQVVEIEVTEEKVSEERKRERAVVDTVRSVLLAGIGALALTKDELEAIVSRLVERGELAEKDARSLLQDLIERRKKESEEWEERMTRRLEPRLQRIVERLNIPTRQDVEALSKRLSALERKIDRLVKEQAKEQGKE